MRRLSILMLILAAVMTLSAQENPSTDADVSVAPDTTQDTVDAPPVSPAANERGRYLVEAVAMCGQCHTPRNRQGTIDDSQKLHGAAVPVSTPSGWPLAFAYKAPRIAGLPQHTDEEFVRLMTTGINRDGETLRLPMPPFRMSQEDALAIAEYLRALP